MNKLFIWILGILILGNTSLSGQVSQLTVIPPNTENLLVFEISRVFENPLFQKIFTQIVQKSPEIKEGLDRFQRAFGENVLSCLPSLKIASGSESTIYDFETEGIEVRKILSYFNGELKRKGQLLKKEELKSKTFYTVSPGTHSLTLMENHLIFGDKDSLLKSLELPYNQKKLESKLIELQDFNGQAKGLWQMPEIMKTNLRESIYASRLAYVNYFLWSLRFEEKIFLRIHAVLPDETEAKRVKDILEILLEMMLKNSKEKFPEGYGILKGYSLKIERNQVSFLLTTLPENLIMLMNKIQ